MESLKIALVSDWFFPSIGGIEYHIHELALNLTKLGHEVHIITRFGQYSDKELPYEVHRFKGSLNVNSFHVSIGVKMLKEINDLYKRERFDLTHGHSIYSPMAIGVANLSIGIRGVPSIVTNHSLLGDSLFNLTYLFLLRASLRKINSFIAVSKAVEKDFRDILGTRGENKEIRVIPNGIDKTFWHPVEDKEEWKEKLGFEGVVVMTTSRLTKRKRIHLIPKIAHDLKKYGIKGVKFLIIGDGHEREKIRGLIEAYGVEKDVLMLGQLPRELIRKYLWASDIYLSPTIYEAFGIAALEALACGIPVVANNHGGISEIVEHGRSGLISPNDKGLLENLAYLIENEGLREEMGKYGRRRVEENFTWDKVVKDIINAYEDTINRFVEEPFVLYKIHQGIKNVGIIDI
jgi:glycosyltransferase involved in cell wall biosynthesis